MKLLIIGAVCVMTVAGCARRQYQNSIIHVERSPEVGVVEEPDKPQKQEEPKDPVVFADYTPKTTFTSIEQMNARVPESNSESILGKVNVQFLEGCYYTGKTSTPFLASFAERWNKNVFLRRFVNAEELFERMNNSPWDSLSTETVRGTMPLLPNEYKLAFKNKGCRDRAKDLVRMLTTIDYDTLQTEKMANFFQELVNVPYDTPEFISKKEMNSVKESFWELYDKTRYVADYAEIQKMRLPEEADYDELLRLSRPLQKRYIAEKDFDAKCIFAIELGCYGFPNAVDYMGELIEDGRYSKYLLEVWDFWRLLAQQNVFGISTWSEIPDNLYDNARLLVAKAYVNHIEKNPSDTFAKLLLMNLIYTENLHRSAGYYGNEAVGAEYLFRTQAFLPDELIASEDESEDEE